MQTLVTVLSLLVGMAQLHPGPYDIGDFHWLDDTWDRSNCGGLISVFNQSSSIRKNGKAEDNCRGKEVVSSDRFKRVGWVVELTRQENSSGAKLGIRDRGDNRFAFSVTEEQIWKWGYSYPEPLLQPMQTGDRLTIVIDFELGELLMQVNSSWVVIVDAGKHIREGSFSLWTQMKNSGTKQTIIPPTSSKQDPTEKTEAAFDILFSDSPSKRKLLKAYDHLSRSAGQQEEFERLLFKSLLANETAHQEWLSELSKSGRLTDDLATKLKKISEGSPLRSPDEKITAAFEAASLEDPIWFYELYEAVQYLATSPEATMERNILLSLFGNERIHLDWLEDLASEGRMTDNLQARLLLQASSPLITSGATSTEQELKLESSATTTISLQIANACIRLRQMEVVQGLELAIQAQQNLIHSLFRQYPLPLGTSPKTLRAEFLEKAQSIKNQLLSSWLHLDLQAASSPSVNDILETLLDAVKSVEGFKAATPKVSEFEEKWKDKLPTDEL